MEFHVLTLIIVSMIWYFALLLGQLHFRNNFLLYNKVSSMEKVTSLTLRERLIVFLKFIVRFQEMYAFMAPKQGLDILEFELMPSILHRH